MTNKAEGIESIGSFKKLDQKTNERKSEEDLEGGEEVEEEAEELEETEEVSEETNLDKWDEKEELIKSKKALGKTIEFTLMGSEEGKTKQSKKDQFFSIKNCLSGSINKGEILMDCKRILENFFKSEKEGEEMEK